MLNKNASVDIVIYKAVRFE